MWNLFSYFATQKTIKLAYFISAWRKEAIQMWDLWLKRLGWANMLQHFMKAKSHLPKYDIYDYKSSHWNVKVSIALDIMLVWKILNSY